MDVKPKHETLGISRTNGVLLKKNPCISGPVQFKPVVQGSAVIVLITMYCANTKVDTNTMKLIQICHFVHLVSINC